MPESPAHGHVALTVSDLSVSVPWYQSMLGSDPVLDEDTGPFRHVVFALPGGTLLGLHQFPEGTDGDRFDERRLGLDHLSFACASRSELEEWQQRLEEMGVAHGGIVDAGYGSGLAFRDPDNIALEFFSAPT
jgi:glyoxylase I family protein